jgi:ABC-type bacteriocin/lantibiotic exporter with double-glycine peptidase domain
MEIMNKLSSKFLEAFLGQKSFSAFYLLLFALVCTLFDVLTFGGLRVFILVLKDPEILLTPDFLFFSQGTGAFILEWTLVMAALLGLRFLVQAKKFRTNQALAQAFESRFRTIYLQKIQTLSPASLRNSGGTAPLVHNLDQALTAFARGAEAIFSGVQAIVQLLVFIPLMFFVSLEMSLIVFFLSIPVIALIQKKIHALGPVESIALDHRSHFTGLFNRWLYLLRSWTIAQHLESAYQHLLHASETLLNNHKSILVQRNKLELASETLSALVIVGVFSMSALLVFQGGTEITSLFYFCLLLLLSYKPVKDCIRLMPAYQGALVSWSKMKILFENDTLNTELVTEHQKSSGVSLSHITFRYANDSPYVFNNFNLEIAPGTICVLRGKNGAGKTTLLKIISGLERPEQGQIILPAKTGVTKMAYLSQSPYFHTQDIKEQLLSLKELNPSLADALGIEIISDKIENKTPPLSENVNEFSGGEKQRIAMALLLRQSADLFLFDEPFSSIPAQDREKIFLMICHHIHHQGQTLIIAMHDHFANLPDYIHQIEL